RAGLAGAGRRRLGRRLADAPPQGNGSRLIRQPAPPKGTPRGCLFHVARVSAYGRRAARTTQASTRNISVATRGTSSTLLTRPTHSTPHSAAAANGGTPGRRRPCQA